MAGHSKWHNIKNKKEATDAKKGKVFGQVSKQIRIAVKEGKSDNPQFNPALRVALDKAKAANMPKENIQKAIDRGMGRSSDGTTFQEMTYEAFGPGGVPLLIVAVTDNQNRTGSDVKFVLSRHNASLGSPGSAMYMFARSEGQSEGQSYQATIPMTVSDEDALKIEKLVTALEEIEDVEEVISALQSTAENSY